MTHSPATKTTAPPEIPTIATHEQQVRWQQQWRTVWVCVAVLQAYYLGVAWLPHPLRLPLAWLTLIPPAMPIVLIAAVGWWWQPWRRPPAPSPFEAMPHEEEPVP